ncbi:MAG: EAL domain-containing protein [Alphaproteobacteria bacterium]|nr:EAL domain-containing protein [Alphaproteobacteria bacterium]
MKQILIVKKYADTVKRILKPIARLLETDLERAVRKEEFIFFYQPQFDLKTGQVKGVEALIRWCHPQKGMINPADFIPMLERTKLINQVTPFLFRQTMDDLKALQKMGFDDLFMSVNLSAVQVEDDKLAAKLTRQLKKSGISAKNYECEITETSVMENVSSAISVLQQISDAGVKLSIDDFGSGYASFDYLRRLSIQKLKIDMAFVASLFEHENNEVILSAMIVLGHRLKLEVLAEGVETKKQEEWLQKNGCDMAQGFYFARPMCFEDLVTFLKNELKEQKTVTKTKIPVSKDKAKKISPKNKKETGVQRTVLQRNKNFDR